MKNFFTVSFFVICTLATGCVSRTVNKDQTKGKKVFSTLDASFVLDTILAGIKVPSSMDWLPGGTALISDRSKRENGMILLDIESGKITPVCNTPVVYLEGGGGIMDILVHPDYTNNGWIYFSYSIMKPDSTSTLVVDRAKLNNNCLEQNERLFEIKPYYKSDAGHFGNRLLIKDGYLFIAMGDRYYARDSAQTLSNHLGKLIRLHENGNIPGDNPFVNRPGALPEIWSYGHRNPQGMAFNTINNELWMNEHGPKGGDEINIIKPGLNYGWPVICYGIDYDGKPIGQGITKKEGMQQPKYYYTPSIGPSGMLFYSGDQFPAWKNNIFIGALALQHINRLVLFENKVVKEERLLEEQKSRIRFLKQGPDSYIYFGIDGGMILRMRPVHTE